MESHAQKDLEMLLPHVILIIWTELSHPTNCYNSSYLTKRHPLLGVDLSTMTKGEVGVWFLLDDVHIFRK